MIIDPSSLDIYERSSTSVSDDEDEPPNSEDEDELRQLQELQELQAAQAELQQVQALQAEANAALMMLNQSSEIPFPEDENQDDTNNPDQQEPDVGWLDHSLHTVPFINLLEKATIDNDYVDDDLKHRLRNPLHGTSNIESRPDILAALKIFIAVSASRDMYEDIRSALSVHPSNTQLPSFYCLKKLIQDETGVTSIPGDMCVKSCMAFSGPYADHDTCPTCGETRYDPVILEKSKGKVKCPRKQYHSIPHGPITQSFWCSVEVALALRHR